MRKWKRFGAIALVAAVLVLAVTVFAALAMEPAATDAFSIDWKVLASGGTTMSSASYTMMSTTGQPVTGTSSSANYSVLSGYWYGLMDVIRNLFMPFITR